MYNKTLKDVDGGRISQTDHYRWLAYHRSAAPDPIADFHEAHIDVGWAHEGQRMYEEMSWSAFFRAVFDDSVVGFTTPARIRYQSTET